MAKTQKDSYRVMVFASIGSRTRVSCLEGKNDNRYTIDADLERSALIIVHKITPQRHFVVFVLVRFVLIYSHVSHFCFVGRLCGAVELGDGWSGTIVRFKQR